MEHSSNHHPLRRPNSPLKAAQRPAPSSKTATRNQRMAIHPHLDQTWSGKPGSSGNKKQQKSQARRDRRFKQRLLLLGLLALAASPSLLAFYFANQTTAFLDVESLDIEKTNHLLAALRDDALPPEQRDPFFGLPQVIVNRAQQQPKEGVSCAEDQSRCCAAWGFHTDQWWSQHYDYQVCSNNQTHSCFCKITNPSHLQFLGRLQKLQWEGDCTSGWQRHQISSGYAAALSSVSRSFYAAFQQNKTFQYNKHRPDASWNFAVKSDNVSHWAFCPNQDMSCYFLPLGHCEPRTIQNEEGQTVGVNNGERGERIPIQVQEYRWLRAYAFRPRHVLRQKLVEFKQQHLPLNPVDDDDDDKSCLVIHVRRTDIAFGKGRRYVAVQEYLDAGHASPEQSIVVLTDDVSTLDEIHEYHNSSQYRWVYLPRPRYRGAEGGFEGFIPSKDPAYEVLSILAELELASNCRKLVHGKSGFVTMIQEAMLEAHDDNQVQFVYLDNQQNKSSQPKLNATVRAMNYLGAIRDRNQQSDE